MNELQSLFKDKNDIQSVIDGVSSGLKEQLISGISGSARSLLISTIYGVKKRPILIVTHQLLQAQQLYDDLVELTDDSSVFLYPVNELIASEMAIASPELKVERIRSLTKWLASDRGIL